MSMREKFEIGKMLESVIVVGDSGRYKYLDGWSDGVVAKELSVSRQAVTAVRAALFGTNFENLRDVTVTEVMRRLTDLDTRLRALEAHAWPSGGERRAATASNGTRGRRWDSCEEYDLGDGGVK